MEITYWPLIMCHHFRLPTGKNFNLIRNNNHAINGFQMQTNQYLIATANHLLHTKGEGK